MRPLIVFRVSDIVRAHVFVAGLVQGVFFRASAAERAEALALSGWIRNTEDGRVEAIFQGQKEAVDEVLRWCNAGPPSASVERVDIAWEDAKPETGFRAR